MLTRRDRMFNAWQEEGLATDEEAAQFLSASQQVYGELLRQKNSQSSSNFQAASTSEKKSDPKQEAAPSTGNAAPLPSSSPPSGSPQEKEAVDPSGSQALPPAQADSQSNTPPSQPNPEPDAPSGGGENPEASPTGSPKASSGLSTATPSGDEETNNTQTPELLSFHIDPQDTPHHDAEEDDYLHAARMSQEDESDMTT